MKVLTVAKGTRTGGADTTPPSYPQTPPPQDLYPTSDIRFVLTAIGGLEAKINRLIDDVGKLAEKASALEKTVDRVWVGVRVGGVLIVAFLGLIWWAMGDRITVAVKNGLQLYAPPSQTGTAPTPKL